VDDSQLSARLKALRGRELARGLDPELLRRFVLYVRRYRYPVSHTHTRVVSCLMLVCMFKVMLAKTHTP